jgi:hypothetical protein
MSRPIVVTVCTSSSSESGHPLGDQGPWHLRAGGGAVHGIATGHPHWSGPGVHDLQIREAPALHSHVFRQHWHCAADSPGRPSPQPPARTLLRCRSDRSGPSAAPAAPVRGRPGLRSRQTHRRWKAPVPPQRFARDRARRQGLHSAQSSCPDRTLPSRAAKQSAPSFGSAGFVHLFHSSLAARPNGGNAFGYLGLFANSSSAGRGSHRNRRMNVRYGVEPGPSDVSAPRPLSESGH